jgi:hypothetical protein
MIPRLALVVAIGLLAQTAIAAAPPVVLPPTATVAGVSQADYAVRWWQWANRSRRGVRPYQDPTGALCGLHQSGEVWFLAGTDGTDDVVRHCTMPVGKYLFFPVITMIHMNTPKVPVSCAQAIASVAENNDHLGQAEVRIDGLRVRNIARHRQRTPECFDAFPDAPYLERKGDQPKDYFPAASDGYWLMVEPLTPGPHTVSVRARYDNKGAEYGDLEQVFEYQLQVGQDSEKKQVPKPRRPGEDIIVQRDPSRDRIALILQESARASSVLTTVAGNNP